jgi:N-acetyl-gamma-glutamyl-phosphate reductase
MHRNATRLYSLPLTFTPLFNNYAQVMHKYTVSVVGARGYSGVELCKLLLQHSAVELTHCFATQNFSLSDYVQNPKAASVRCLPDSEITSNLTDIVFLATPAEVSLHLAPKLLALGCKVIDLSGAFRLKNNDYKKWYGFEHTEAAALQQAAYGLVPWIGPGKKEMLIANPGCYASAASLALIPLLKENLIDPASIVIDAKSGTSGGGRKPSENLLFTEVDGECLPYKVGKHQHFPEIQETVKQFSGMQIDPHFTTSLIPTRRGIIAGVYARLSTTSATPTQAREQILAAYKKYYPDNSLIETSPLAQKSQLLLLKRVVGTAKTHISFEVEGEKVYIFSLIDNLLKGAASQAVENLNRLLDLAPQTGLTSLEAIL